MCYTRDVMPPPGRPGWSGPGRPSRPRRALPRPVDGVPRSLWCVDLRAVEEAWLRRPLGEIRIANRGGRLGALFGELDVDPRRSIRHNARTLPAVRAQQLYDALCEELADAVLHDLPGAVWGALLPLLAPHGQGENPYPADGTLPTEDALLGGLVIVAEGRVEAEAAAVACAHTPHPPMLAWQVPPAIVYESAPAPPGSPGSIDPLLWTDVMGALMSMLDAVRDKNRALLIDA